MYICIYIYIYICMHAASPWVTRRSWETLSAGVSTAPAAHTPVTPAASTPVAQGPDALPHALHPLPHALHPLHVLRGMPACVRAGLLQGGGVAEGVEEEGMLVRVRVEVAGRGVPRAHARVRFCCGASHPSHPSHPWQQDVAPAAPAAPAEPAEPFERGTSEICLRY
jgi:hypothetical protein